MFRDTQMPERPVSTRAWWAAAAAGAVFGLLAARPIGAQTCSLGFSAGDYGMGSGARAVAVADFDGDGDLDVATSDLSAGTVTVALNDGMGSFAAARVINLPPGAQPASPFSLIAADFDNNGRPDLAVADLNVPNDRILVLINDGNWPSSGFGASIVTSGLPGGAWALAAGDFNRDGKADLAVAVNTNAVSILDGVGDGTFTGPTNYGVGGPGAITRGIVVGDFDRNGWADFAALVDHVSDYVSYRYGSGSGFGSQSQATITAASTHSVDDLVLADFNGDGRPDLVAAGNDFGPSQFGVYFLKGNAGGGFDAPGAGDFFPTAPSYAYSLAVGDFDADGAPDLAVPNGDGAVQNTLILSGNGDGTFDTPGTPIGADRNPSGAGVGDFNRDGRDDLVVANSAPGNMRVHLNLIRTGSYSCFDASFGPFRRAFPTGGQNPISVVRGDLNGDGRLDLVVANYDSDTVRVLLGTGLAEFDPRPPITVGDGPYHVAVADFNGDVLPDLAVANSGPGGNSVSLLRGDGAGNFVPFGSDQSVGLSPVSIEVLNFDGDTKADLAVANLASASVSILRGNGDGSFFPLPAVDLPGSNPTALARGEFNGDGHADLAVADGANHKVWLLLGDGAGAFAASGFPVAAAAPRSLTVADFDGDTHLDVATANQATNDVSILLGDGDGNLGTPDTFGAGSNPQWIAHADLDADGRPDLVTADAGNTLTVLLNTGSGFNSSPVVVAGTPKSIETGDFDRDGALDLAMVAAQPQSVIVLRGNGTGSFAGVPPEYSAGGTPRLLSVADVDQNGFLDLVLPHGSNRVAVLSGLGGGAFGAPTILTAGSSPEQAVAGDFNRDGKVDLAVANGTSNDVSIFFGSPLGSAAPLPVGGGQKSIATADFDQDGDLDLALARGTSVEIYRNDGSGGFGFLESLPGFTTAQFIAIGDFNEDGDPDLAVADSAAGLVRVFRGRLGNDAGFNALTPASVGTQPRYIAVADLDRNGTLDLAVANQGSDNLTLLSGSGTGSFGAFSGFSPLATGLKPTAVVAGDFNVDGRPDLAVSHLDSSTVAFHIALPTSGFAPARAFPLAGLVVPSLAAGDFNRDGRPDVAAPDTGTTKVAVLLSTSCTATRMGILQQPYSCTSGSPFPLQPKVGVTDDGGNPTYCDGNGNVTATLLGGGSLGGTPERPVANAVADWASGGGPLSVTPGGRFRLKFQHELGYTAVSRSISLDLMVSVSGPTDLCAGQMGSYASNSLGYDRYDWRLDAMPVSVAPTYHMPGQAPGTRFLDLQISQDACFASLISPYVVTVNPDLSPITIAVAGGTTICQATGCTGGTAMEAPLHIGGGVVTYQWGFRTVSGVSNPITFIPGATNPSYLLNGPDFPGPGVYYLILRMTPACGAVQTSNEVVVTVDNSMLQDIVRFFTVTSKKGENKLEWINPPSPPYPGPTVTVDIHRKASTTNCSLPGDYPNNPFALPLTSVSGTANQKSEYSDLAVADGTTYCYTLFVVKVPGTDYSAGRSNRGRPFDNSGGQPQEHIRWAYSVGTTSIVPPGVGVDAIHMAANDNTIHSVTKGEAATSGTWPASWRPFPMNGPSQGRPTTITAGGLGAPKVIYLGSQDGNAYAIDAESGVPLWSKFLAPGMVQAGPSGIFASFGSAWGITYNHILVGTRDGASPNKFYALDASNDGQIVWSQDGVAAGYGRMGIISSQALVDYANQRVYFTSYAFGPAPDDRTVWCVSLGGPIPNPPPGTVIWARAYGNVTTAPTLRGNVLYVGTSDGKVKALDASTGDPVWPADFDTFTGQPIKGHVLPDRLTNELYFSTNDKVWAIRDMVTYGEAKWNFPNGYVALPGASTPVYLPGGLYVYVGDGNGHLHRLEAATGAESPGVPATFPLQLGDGSGIVGSPTLDTRQGFLYVGTDAGVVYAVKLIP